jgi:hypothetical protein
MIAVRLQGLDRPDFKSRKDVRQRMNTCEEKMHKLPRQRWKRRKGMMEEEICKIGMVKI